ncbi:hypothetical protein TUM20984_50110 [Mycobacterium antarcticum]|nr:hypothetical protein TUM20984_50110 [Mycolicibacterium sp. TUM20984]
MVQWLAEYEYTFDGRVRDRSRNVLTEHGPDHSVFIRLASGQRKSFEKRELLTLEWRGLPPRAKCCVCGRGPHYGVVHLDGDRRNCHALNLKWAPDPLATREHERRCLRRTMQPAATPWGRDYPPGCHAPECGCTRCGADHG